MSYRAVAKQVGCHHTTISRELRRHSWANPSGYDARQARLQLARTRLAANQHHRKLPTNARLVVVVTERLLRHDSPEQIAGWFKSSGAKLRVCAQTIYDWIYTYAKELVVQLHCRKGKYRRTRENTLRKAFRNKLKEVRTLGGGQCSRYEPKWLHCYLCRAQEWLSRGSSASRQDSQEL